ncbi:hypothetical protein HDV00_003057 [Rhizophlyctis rosea]|nr:hypothetical protein HDV00_003057 [Rhizophlyctis rosea]
MAGLEDDIIVERVNSYAGGPGWSGILFQIPNPCTAAPPPPHQPQILTQQRIALLPLPLTSSECPPSTALQTLVEAQKDSLVGIIAYIPAGESDLLNPSFIGGADLDSVHVPVVVVSTEVGERVRRGLGVLEGREGLDGVGAGVPVSGGGQPGATPTRRQADGREGYWMGMADVQTTRVKTSMLPYPGTAQGDSMDAGLLWQFGLALIAGVLFFGIPCTCLISWFARRRLDQQVVELEDLEAALGDTPADGGPIVEGHVMEKGDLEQFPVKVYRKAVRIGGKVDVGKVSVNDDEGGVAMAAEEEGVGRAKGDDEEGEWHETFDKELSYIESPSHTNTLDPTPSSTTLIPPSTSEADITDISLHSHTSTTTSTSRNRPLPTNPTRNASAYSTLTSYSTIDTCAICLDVFEDGSAVRQLPCRHFFHKDCIAEWVTKRNGVCPICRIDLLPHDTEAPNTPLEGAEITAEDVEVASVVTEHGSVDAASRRSSVRRGNDTGGTVGEGNPGPSGEENKEDDGVSSTSGRLPNQVARET